MKNLSAFILLLFCLSSQAIAQYWSPFPCATDYPASLLVADGNTLYISRYNPSQVIKYDAAGGCQQLSLLPDPQQDIRAMAVYNGELYVSGYSFDTTHIYKWTSSGWSVIGTCYQSIVNAMEVYNNELYVGGLIYDIDGTLYGNIARWNGNVWSDPGGGLPGQFPNFSARVRSLKVYNGELYAGGNNLGLTNNGIMKWNGTSWSSVGGGLYGTPDAFVFTLEVYNSQLYAGGLFNNAGGVAVHSLARWNGASWNDVDGGVGGTDSLVTAMTVFNNNLFIGGSFSTPSFNLVQYNGSSLTPVTGTLNGGVACLETYGNSLVAGGGFSWSQNGNTIENLARFSSCNSVITASGPQTYCSGGSVTLTAPAGTAWQWKLNSSNLFGANSQNLLVTTIGGVYTCIANTACGVIPSATASVIVRPVPSATVTASGPTTFCSLDSVILSANTGAGYTYKWYKYANLIAGATSSSYKATTSGKYKVEVTNVYSCSKKSTATTVTVNPLPTASITASGPTSFCAGDSVVLNATTNTPGSTFSWKRYSNVIAGATSATYSAKITGKYKAVVTSPAGCVRASNAINVAVVCREVARLPESEASVFPNPASDELFVSGGETDARIVLCNIMGKILYETELNAGEEQLRMDISGLPSGLYLVSVISASHNEVFRIVKQ
jgi:hypothetical protein